MTHTTLKKTQPTRKDLAEPHHAPSQQAPRLLGVGKPQQTLAGAQPDTPVKSSSQNFFVIDASKKTPSWTMDAFDSDTWTATNPNPGTGGNESISFTGVPPQFRLAIKELFSAIDQTSTYGRRRAKSAGTARIVIAMARHFTSHLHAAGVELLSAATRPQVEKAILDYYGLLDGAPITSGRASRYIGLLSQLHHMGPHGHQNIYISDGLSFDPAAAAINIGRSNSLAKSKSTPELSEKTGRDLMLMSIDWVENKSEAVLWIANAYAELSRAKARTKHADKSQAYALKSIQAFLADNPDFRAQLVDVRKIMGQGPLINFLSKRQPTLATLTDIEADCMSMGLIAQNVQLTYQGFCYVVCAGFNGWRANEIFSMDASALTETPGGHMLRTQVRKTAINPNDATDRPVPPIVARAVASLAKVNEKALWAKRAKNARSDDSESLGATPGTAGSEPASKAPSRESAENSAIQSSPVDDVPDSVPTSSGSIFRSSTGSLIDTNDMSNRITAAWRQFTGSNERITTHQFRRFFALFYLRRHQGNLDAIRRHFRHVSRDMVWAYVKDGLNAEYMAKEKKVLAGEIAHAVVFGKGYTSNSVAKELKEVRSSLRFQGKTLSIEDAASFITTQIEQAFVDLHAMEWGYCLLQRGESGAACEGKTGPIEARSAPGTCGRCKFLCTGPENVPFWQQTALLHQEVTNNPKATLIMRSESERLLATARNILARHLPANPTGESS